METSDLTLRDATVEDVVDLVASIVDWRDHRAKYGRRGPVTLHYRRMADAEMSLHNRLRDAGEALNRLGGLSPMRRAYFAAVRQHGPRAEIIVRSAWRGIGSWRY
ncbi:hypothetical protein [Zavarzinia sp. CC-PAN008]|uniref:hypothetical protein n=1 Tax=Zavarzinia sp. CC-PAN008 TaxID=3243332 RepID=UPI003F744E8E